MEVKNNPIDQLQGTVTINIEKKDYEEKVNEELKKLRKKVSMKGFRPGHVPISLIKKLYGTDVLIEKVNELVSQALLNFIKENNLRLVGDFIPVEEETKFDPNKDENFTFTFDYATTSKPFVNYEQISVPYYIVDISDQDVDNEIKKIQQTFGQYVDDQEIKDDKNIFYLTFIELDDNNQPLENGLRKDDILLSLNMIDEKLRDQFIGKKENDELIVKLDQLMPSPEKRASMLNLKKEDLDTISNNFKIIITKIKRFQEAELNQDLFKKYSPDEPAENLEQFKQIVRKKLENFFKEQADALFRQQAKEILTKSTEVKIPEEFIRRWLSYRQKSKKEQDRLSEADIEKILPDLIKQIKWDRILEQIAQDLNIKLEREDALNLHAQMIKSYLQNYGLDVSQFDDSFFYEQAQSQYDKLSEDERYRIDSTAFELKVLNALKDKVKLEEKHVSIDMFDSIIKQANETQTPEQNQDSEQKSDEQEQSAQTSEQQTDETEQVDQQQQSPEQKNEQSAEQQSSASEKSEQTEENNQN